MPWGRVAKYVLWKAEEKWRAKGWGLPFGGQHDNEYVLRGMMWADNYWLFSDNREKLIFVVNIIIWELLDLTLRVGSGDRAWGLPFREVFDVLGYRLHRDGKGFQGAERTMCKGLRSWWRDKYICRSNDSSDDGQVQTRPQSRVQHSPDWQH